MTNNTIDRRRFLKQAAAGAAIAFTYPSGRIRGANDRVRLGIIGAGARGQELMREFLSVPNVEFVAVAEVPADRSRIPRAGVRPGQDPAAVLGIGGALRWGQPFCVDRELHVGERPEDARYPGSRGPQDEGAISQTKESDHHR